jgi:hypothetical protein
MSLFTIGAPPRLPDAPPQYDTLYMAKLLSVLYLYFQNNNAVQQLNLAKLNLDINTLPTDADLANLKVGDVYRDLAGNVLKIKV